MLMISKKDSISSKNQSELMNVEILRCVCECDIACTTTNIYIIIVLKHLTFIQIMHQDVNTDSYFCHITWSTPFEWGDKGVNKPECTWTELSMCWNKNPETILGQLHIFYISRFIWVQGLNQSRYFFVYWRQLFSSSWQKKCFS